MKNFNSIAVFLLGYVRIQFSGDYCERFLNVLAANGIVFRNIQKYGGNFYITVLKKDFKKLHKLRKNCGVKIKTIKKSGIPFIINKHKFRYGMVAGLTFFILILSFLSTRLWLVKINGNNTVTEAKIDKSLDSLGIKIGMSMNKIDTDVLKLKFVISGENIAWASFNRQGSILEVNLTEFENDKTQNTASNLVAQYDAIIKRIDVQSGTVNVKIGETVSKGQLLVSGIVDYGAGSNFVSSNGKIFAEVNVNEKIVVPKNYKTYEYTGEAVDRYVVDIMGAKIPLYLGNIDEGYEKDYKTIKLKLFGGRIPLEILKVNCKKIKENTTYLSKPQAIEIAKKQIENNYINENCTDIIFISENIIEDTDSYQYSCTVKFQKDIAKREEIFFEID